MIAYLCQTPAEQCTGRRFDTTKGLGLSHKGHSSSVEAFACYKKYLLASGFTQVDPHGFKDPKDGQILVLTKAIRYGGRLRGGKTGGQATTSKKRVTPKRRTSGIIIG